MKHRIYRGLLVATLIAAPLAVVADEGGFLAWFSPKRLKEVDPVSNARYESECSACHFAYQPGLLPQRSWKKLFEAEALADHFGENAELPEEVRQQLLSYAVANAADNSNYKRSRKVMASTPDDVTPLRITEVRYIKRKHQAIPTELIAGNPQVRSLSNCNACHTKASEGIFDDDTVNIKGHGPWH